VDKVKPCSLHPEIIDPRSFLTPRVWEATLCTYRRHGGMTSTLALPQADPVSWNGTAGVTARRVERREGFSAPKLLISSNATLGLGYAHPAHSGPRSA
jgi:hypothetical protein